MLLAACGLAAVSAAPASAASYRVHSCQMPDGQAIGFDGWDSQICGEPGSNSLVMFGGPWNVGYSQQTSFKVPAGSGLAIDQAYLNLWGEIEHTFDQEQGTPFMRAKADATTLVNCVWTCNDFSTNSTFTTTGAQTVSVEIGCTGPPTQVCTQSYDPMWFPRVSVSLLQATFTVRDSAPPSVGPAGVEGTIRAATGARGTATVAFDALDGGSGVRYVVADFAGTEVARYTPNANDGKCADAGASVSDDHEFTAVRPCPTSQRVQFNVDTTKAPDGPQTLRIRLIDAAGNTATVFDQPVTVDNAPRANPPVDDVPPVGESPQPPIVEREPIGGGGGGGGSTPVPVGAKLTLDKQSSGELRSGFGKSRMITGTLVDVAKQPIAGASVTVATRLRLMGAAWEPAGSVTTDAKGRFSFKTIVKASRLIRFNAGSSQVEAKLGALAKLTIAGTKSIKRGSKLKLSGAVKLDGLPARGVRIEIQSRYSGSWRSVDSVQTRKNGKWSWSYRVMRAKGKLPFRALLVPTSDVAAEGGTSRTFGVKVR